ncbi:MAG: MspA family porin [Mycobacterium sp.]|nr:MspA family porin [Mycobacterium sp.]
MVRRAALVACVAAVMAASPVHADPDQPAPDVPSAVTPPDAAPLAAVGDGKAIPPVDDGKVVSAPPATTKAPDGWTLTVSSKDETQTPVAPLTTALSTREYVVGGVFNGAMKGPGGGTPEGIFEVGYQIGCGIDMSTSNGVSLTGTAGIQPSIGYFGFDFPGVLPDGILPGVGANIAGGITVGLKPGLVTNVPVTKKEYKSSEPWVSISNFRVKIDGCVGESFIRSFATLTKSTDQGDAILSWYGTTKAV